MKTPSSFCTRYFIPFHLADPAGVLFFGHTFTLMHQAYEQFIINHLRYSWDEWFNNPLWIVPVRVAEAEYLQPILAGRDCELKLEITSTTPSSFTLTSTIYQNDLCCKMKTVHVFCNREIKKKISIPDDIAVLFENQSHQLQF